MPVISVIRDIDEQDYLHGLDPEMVIHCQDPKIVIGTLKGGMASGKTSVMIVIRLDDGRFLCAESSLECIKAAFQVLSAIP